MKKSKLTYFLVFVLLCYFSYQLGSYSHYKTELRQLTKDKLRLEI